MTCITGFAENSPCAYRAILGTVGVCAAIAVAISAITLLANLNYVNFSGFHLSTPCSLGIGIPSALVLATACTLAIHACCKKKSVVESTRERVNPHEPDCLATPQSSSPPVVAEPPKSELQETETNRAQPTRIPQLKSRITPETGDKRKAKPMPMPKPNPAPAPAPNPDVGRKQVVGDPPPQGGNTNAYISIKRGKRKEG